MRLGVLWTLLPDSALPLVFVLACMALIVGLVRAKAVFKILGLILLMPLLPPIIDPVLAQMPGWLVVLVLLALGIGMLRGLASLFLGSRGADHMVGILAADVVRFLVRVLFLPFRLLGWGCRWLMNRV